MHLMRFFFAQVLICFAATTFAADPAKPNYYPLVKGTKWEYRVSAQEREISLTCEIVDSGPKDGKTYARIEAQLPNSIILREELSLDVNGVYRNVIMGAKLDQPIPIIKYPVKARDVWRDKIKVGDLDGTFVIAIKDIAAKIEVPAGKFTTLEIESTVEMNGEKVVACIWYAEGIGIVKQETTCGAHVVLMELKKHTTAK
jgi:hypothetical protein